MKNTIATVNVIEYTEGGICSVHSFMDEGPGNKAAKRLFSRMAMENGMNKEDKRECVECGYYKAGVESYQLFLVHSEL